MAFNCGDKHWPDLYALVHDASKYKEAAEYAKVLEATLWWVLKRTGPVRIPEPYLEMGIHKGISSINDIANRELILEAKE